MNIVLISGSLRTASYNTALLKSVETYLRPKAEIVWGSIELPLFNQDMETPTPEAVAVLKKNVEQADGMIIATPEYNRALPGGLKNALDWLTRPAGKSSLKNKNVLPLTVSTGSISGALAYYQLCQVLIHTGSILPVAQEFMMGNAGDKFSDTNELVDETTRTRLQAQLDAFVAAL